jgi:hypothetical protein
MRGRVCRKADFDLHPVKFPSSFVLRSLRLCLKLKRKGAKIAKIFKISVIPLILPAKFQILDRLPCQTYTFI